METKNSSHSGLTVRSEDPLNAETIGNQLCESFLTPNATFFVRNHGPVPDINVESYRLKVGGLTMNDRVYSLDEIKGRFPRVELAATLQCAGNRRNELGKIRGLPGQVSWEIGAIGTAKWIGASLRHVLKEAGLQSGGRFVEFTGEDRIKADGMIIPFGGSVPVTVALREDVLLAYEMNGQPLPREHGAPLRVIVPGYIGARSVKWVSSIKVRYDPSDNYFQSTSYRLKPPGVQRVSQESEEGMMLGETSVNCAICNPKDGEVLTDSKVTVRGYAMAGGRRSIEGVDISADGGKSWQAATLGKESFQWAWRLWEADMDLNRGTHEITARAWDSSANTQPETPEQIWNEGGYMSNAWHRVKVVVEG